MLDESPFLRPIGSPILYIVRIGEDLVFSVEVPRPAPRINRTTTFFTTPTVPYLRVDEVWCLQLQPTSTELHGWHWLSDGERGDEPRGGVGAASLDKVLSLWPLPFQVGAACAIVGPGHVSGSVCQCVVCTILAFDVVFCCFDFFSTQLSVAAVIVDISVSVLHLHPESDCIRREPAL